MLPENLPLRAVPDGLGEFVDDVLLSQLTGGSRDDNTVWCAEWREHPDAVYRLAAIHDEWLHLVAYLAEVDDNGEVADSGMDVSLHGFLRDVLDYHMPMLVDHERGAFRACKHGNHVPHRRLDAPRRGSVRGE